MPPQSLQRRARGGDGLDAEREEHFFDPGCVAPGLLQMPPQELREELRVGFPGELRQYLQGQDAFDPERLAEELQEEVARVAQLADSATLLSTAGSRLSPRSRASRSESAMIASAGFAAPWVGKTLPSATNRFGIPHTR